MIFNILVKLSNKSNVKFWPNQVVGYPKSPYCLSVTVTLS